MNNIIVYGRLGRDCEIKDVNGNKVMELNICQCQRKNDTESPLWWHASFWGDKYAKLEQYLKKGSAVIISGEMSPPYTYQSKTAGWTTSLKIKGNDLKFNPFGGAKSEKDENESGEKIVEYPGTFQPKKSDDEIGDLF